MQQTMKNIISFPSDKNGCGFYRTIIPLEYLSSKLSWNTSFIYHFVFDVNLIMASDYIRFQRQCTNDQLKCVTEYRNFIDRTPARNRTKIVYELDDIVHGIEPQNIIAYQFYTKTRRENVLKMMRMSNMVTFSTKFLKHFYQREHGINNSVVVPNLLPKFLWNPDYTIDKRPRKSKPVIMWAGSASHVGPGGDLEFLIPLIEKTMNEFEWLFIGCMPPSLMKYRDEGKISFQNWEQFYDYPRMMQTLKADLAIAPVKDSLFNYAKSDLKYLEYAAMNIPTICSSIGKGIGPYNQTNCKMLIDNNADDWYNAIKKMLTNEELYYDCINSQHEFLNARWLESPENIKMYQEVYA